MNVYDVQTSIGLIRVLSENETEAVEDAKLVAKHLQFREEAVVETVHKNSNSERLQQYCRDQGGHLGIHRCAKICGFTSREYRTSPPMSF